MGDLEGKARDAKRLRTPNMESEQDFLGRIISFWDKLIENRDKDKNVLVVGHGAWIGYLLRYLAEVKKYGVVNEDGIGRRAWYIPNASVQVIEIDGNGNGNGRITRWADTTHLQGEEGTADTNADFIGDTSVDT